MSSKCGDSTHHELCITVSLNGELTIEFPHRSWASAFCNLIQESEYLEDRKPRVRGPDSRHVRLDLTKAVNRVQFLGVDEYGGSVIFAFVDVEKAQQWLDNSGLWLNAGGDKLKLPSRWSHKRFDNMLRTSSKREKDEGRKKDVTRRGSFSKST
jgi:hypothetical protein